MPKRPPSFRPHSQPTRKDQNRAYDLRRGSARDRGYGTAWDKAARAFLRENPLCAYCELRGKVAASELVDHLYPHKGDQDIFWAVRWWVAACTTCHSGFKQQVERQGKAALDALAHRLGRPTLGG